jgi:predicted nucleotidyltransferase
MPAAVSHPTQTLRNRAQALADEIIAADKRVAAVVLYGSVAVEQDGPGSDIDLLVLSRERVRLYELGDLVHGLDAPDLNMSCHTQLSLDAVATRDWSFVACLADQAELLAGDPRALSWLDRPQPSWEVSAHQLDGMLRWLNSAVLGYELDEDGVQALHEVYRITRCAVVLANAAAGVRVWRRHAALAALAANRPELAGAVSQIAALEPYWRAYHRGEDLQAPDPDPHQVQSAFDTARVLISDLIAAQRAAAA